MNLTSKAKHFWIDERGFIISAELVIIATILVLGLIVGLSSIQNAIVGEFFDISQAFCSLNQSYFVRGFRGCKSWTASSAYFRQNNCGVCAGGFDNSFGGGAVGYGGGAVYGGGGAVGGIGSGGGMYEDSSSTFSAPSTSVAPSGTTVIPSAPQSCPGGCPATAPATTAPCNECLTAPGSSMKLDTPVSPRSTVEPGPMMAPGAVIKK